MTPEQQKALAIARAKRARAAAQGGGESQAPVDQSASGMLWPISRDAQGNTSFDSNAGLMGAVKRSIMLPGEVMRGDVPVRGQDGNITQDVIERSGEMAGVFSGVNPAIRSGSRAIDGVSMAMKDPKVIPPTYEHLLATGGKQLDDLGGMSVDYSAGAVKNAALDARVGLDGKGFSSDVSPKTFKIIDALSRPPEDSVAPLSGIINAQKKLKRIKPNALGGEDAEAARILRGKLDEFLGAPSEGAVVAGPAAKVGEMLKTGNANYAAGKRSEKFHKLGENAEHGAAAANSGLNFGNKTRGLLDSLRKNDDAMRGFNDAEKAAVSNVIKGSSSENATRYIGNLLGGGGGLGAAVTGMGAGIGAGGYIGGPAGALAGGMTPIIGALSKKASNRMTGKSLNKVDEMVRARSPLAKSMQKNAPKQVEGPTKRAALIRALIMQQMQLQQGIDPRATIMSPNGA